jgi:hypothetical protein
LLLSFLSVHLSSPFCLVFSRVLTVGALCMLSQPPHKPDADLLALGTLCHKRMPEPDGHSEWVEDNVQFVTDFHASQKQKEIDAAKAQQGCLAVLMGWLCGWCGGRDDGRDVRAGSEAIEGGKKIKNPLAATQQKAATSGKEQVKMTNPMFMAAESKDDNQVD